MSILNVTATTDYSLTDLTGTTEISFANADPESRLLDEVFWFWSMKPDAAEDAALRALAAGHAKEAAAVWAAESQKGDRSHVALHNLAVLEHLIALDYEAKLAASGLDDKSKTRLGDLWAKALGRWLETLNSEAFWEDVRLRVRTHRGGREGRRHATGAGPD